MTLSDPEETRTDPMTTVPARPSEGGAHRSLRLPDRYELGERFGKGGFGCVFTARDRLIGRDVAIKVLARAGFVHADLKPPNVLVQPDGTPVILDLGVTHSPLDGTPASLGGTPLFMAHRDSRRDTQS